MEARHAHSVATPHSQVHGSHSFFDWRDHFTPFYLKANKQMDWGKRQLCRIFCRPVERRPSGHDVITSSQWAPFPGTGEAASLQETPHPTPRTQHQQAAIAAATSGGLGEKCCPAVSNTEKNRVPLGS